MLTPWTQSIWDHLRPKVSYWPGIQNQLLHSVPCNTRKKRDEGALVLMDREGRLWWRQALVSMAFCYRQSPSGRQVPSQVESLSWSPWPGPSHEHGVCQECSTLHSQWSIRLHEHLLPQGQLSNSWLPSWLDWSSLYVDPIYRQGGTFFLGW